MPPRKQPKTLQDLSLKTLGSFMVKVFVAIERKHKKWSIQACKNDLEIVETYLSPIQHLCDDLWKTLFDFFCGLYPADNCFYLNFDYYYNYEPADDRYILLGVLLCNKLRKLEVSELDEYSYCCKDSEFWTSHLSKLTNVVELDILNVRLTHKSFRAIGDNCSSVRKIAVTSDLTYACMQSLKHLLNCKELQDVTIIFRNWSDHRKSEYIKMFVTRLPKLEYYDDWLQPDAKEVLSIAKPIPSMRKVRVMEINSAELKALLRVCPNLTDIGLGVSKNEDQNNVIKILTESSLQLDALALHGLSFSHDMIQSMRSKLNNLISLRISERDGDRIGLSVTDIRTIGVNCPKVEKLWIGESFSGVDSDSTNDEEEDSVWTPRAFVSLKTLYLRSNITRKQRILPVILRHANNLEDVTLNEVFRPAGNSVDILSVILDANALTELQKLVLVVEWGRREPHLKPLRVTSIERLLNGCPKLTKLCLKCPMEDAASEYLRERKSSMKIENFDFALLNSYEVDYYCSER